jgi:hypothetical protein
MDEEAKGQTQVPSWNESAQTILIVSRELCFGAEV